MIKNRFYSHIKKRGLLEKYIEVLDEKEEEVQNPMVEDIPVPQQTLRNILETHQELPIFNRTYHELCFDHPEDELQFRIFS